MKGGAGAHSSTDGALVDVHAHNLCSDIEDVEQFLGGWPDTDSEERAARLASLRYDSAGDEQVSHSVIMGQYGGVIRIQPEGLGDPSVPMPSLAEVDTPFEGPLKVAADDLVKIFGVSDTPTMDAVTAKIFETYEETDSGYEGYFLPYFAVSHRDLGYGPDAAERRTFLTDMVNRFDEGWVGVGEIFVHGHLIDMAEEISPTLVEACGLAAEHGKPISIHWDFGLTDGGTRASDGHFDSPRDGSWNFSQLKSFLASTFASSTGDSVTPTLIVCHCGVGPGVSDDTGHYDLWDFSGRFAEWQANIEELLSAVEFENVHFDLAGMQVGSSTGRTPVWSLFDADLDSLTPLGEYLLSQIDAYPTRFLVGTDADTTSDEDESDAFGIDTYSASIAMYRTFLDMGSLTEETKQAVLYGNAERLLFGTSS